MTDLPDAVRPVLPIVEALPGVVEVQLCGSRFRGDAGPFSDWDFAVLTENFETTAARLPCAIRAADPLAAQWDRLSSTACFMLIVPGPQKIDLIFEGVAHTPEPPWILTAATLPEVDAHFWDWTLWLVSKLDAGRHDVVESELNKMHEYLLEPLGVRHPASLARAVMAYVDTLPQWESQLAVGVDRSLQNAVAPIVHHLE